jgi:APA family basic amino acid/polyamine antiporter
VVDVATPLTLRAAGRGVAYDRVLVPLTEQAEPAASIACGLAAEHGALVTVLVVIEVPAELPLDAHMVDEEASARRILKDARAIGEHHGVSVAMRVVRARTAGEAIVDEASRTEAEVIVLGAARRKRARRSAPVFGGSTTFVLKHAPCRVLLAALARDEGDDRPDARAPV